MTIDLSQLHTVFLIVLPALVGVVAGLIRQDKFPKWANELILLALIGVVGLVQALLDGKIGASPLADFMIISGYCAAAIHLKPINDLMASVQSATSVGGGKAPDSPSSSFLNLSDLQQIGNLLAPLLAQELVKLRLASNIPVVQPQSQQQPVQQQPSNFTTPVPQPPYANPVQPQPQALTDPNQIYNLQTQSVQSVPPQSWTRQGG